MKLDIHTMGNFIKWWIAQKYPPLNNDMLAVLKIFYNWLNEREAHPPDLGISVNESIGIKDKMA